jgi:hypothetical protein
MSSAPEKIDITDGQDHKITDINLAKNLPSGNNRFRFYTGETLLRDTLLSVEPYKTHVYTLFKPNANAQLKIFDSRLNGLDKELLPDSGFVKFSLANFSKSLPGKVNISISTQTYTPFSDKPIQVGEFLNVSNSFSGFHTVMVGVNQSSNAVNTFTLTIKNPDNNLVLATIPLVLPVSATAGSIGKLTGSIYIIYLNDSSNATILMSK